MTTTLAPSSAIASELRDIPLSRLLVAEWNARKTFDRVALEELTESVRQHGVQVPLLVRPIADRDEEELYEIVAGHRRAKAATAAQWSSAPCIVRELTDQQAREIGLVDNLQREDVPALEEADAYAELQQTLGTAAAIAQRVGKDVGYVTKRLQLVQLAANARIALQHRLITIDHALVIATLGEEEQDWATRYVLHLGEFAPAKTDLARQIDDLVASFSDPIVGRFDPHSVAKLKDEIELRVNLQLGRAPWDLADANLLPDAGPCTTCPKNTAANTALFSDLAIGEATCTDSFCFNAKRVAFVQIAVEAVKAAGAGVVRLSWNASTAKPRFLKDSTDVNPDQTFKAGQWVAAKKGSCEHVVTGVTVDYVKQHGYMGSSDDEKKLPGQKLLVCVAAKCKAHPKDWEKAAKSGGGTKFDAKAYEAEQQRKREAAIAESKLRVAAASAALEKITKLPEAALRLVLLDGRNVNSQEHNALVPGLRKILQTAPLDSPQFAKAVAAISIEAVRAWDHHEVGAWRPQFIASLKALGYDASKHWAKPKAEKSAAKKAAAKPAKKAAKKGGRK